MSKLGIIINGLIKENPTFVLLLGIICSNFVISCLKNLIPDKVHIPCYIVVIAGFVTVVQLLLKAYAPAVDEKLGLFIPLIVVNCIVLGRAESFAAKNSPVDSACDGIGIGLGFTCALTLIGLCRELLGAGTVFGASIYPEQFGALTFVLAPGAFITLGFLVAIFNKLTAKK